jgi:hypothetical protein
MVWLDSIVPFSVKALLISCLCHQTPCFYNNRDFSIDEILRLLSYLHLADGLAGSCLSCIYSKHFCIMGMSVLSFSNPLAYCQRTLYSSARPKLESMQETCWKMTEVRNFLCHLGHHEYYYRRLLGQYCTL